MSNTVATALSARNLRKVYGGTVALADVDVEINVGEIHGLLGENGAGKSTLVRLIAGLEPADGGSLSMFGSELPSRFSADDVAARGVVFIHQNLGLVEDMSVAENIALAAGYSKSGPFISWRGTRQRALEALDKMGVDLNPDALVGELPMSLRSITAIGRALMRDVRLLVLDEPTATLGAHEVERLFGILRRLRDQGVAIILITHRLDEIVEITDRVTVLRDGKLVGVARSSEISEEELVRMIIGSYLPPREINVGSAGDQAMRFDDVRAGVVGPLSFEVRAGEVHPAEVEVTEVLAGEVGAALRGLRLEPAHHAHWGGGGGVTVAGAGGHDDVEGLAGGKTVDRAAGDVHVRGGAARGLGEVRRGCGDAVAGRRYGVRGRGVPHRDDAVATVQYAQVARRVRRRGRCGVCCARGDQARGGNSTDEKGTPDVAACGLGDGVLVHRYCIV